MKTSLKFVLVVLICGLVSTLSAVTSQQVFNAARSYQNALDAKVVVLAGYEGAAGDYDEDDYEDEYTKYSKRALFSRLTKYEDRYRLKLSELIRDLEEGSRIDIQRLRANIAEVGLEALAVFDDYIGG